jgi:hypothetical protein
MVRPVPGEALPGSGSLEGAGGSAGSLKGRVFSTVRCRPLLTGLLPVAGASSKFELGSRAARPAVNLSGSIMRGIVSMTAAVSAAALWLAAAADVSSGAAPRGDLE